MFSLAASITGLALIAQTSAHVSLINIYGSNNVVGHAFGVNLFGKYPRVKGVPGDAGGDSGVFQTGTDDPSPACGRTPELGPIDIPAWLNQAEGYGLPAAYANMSVVVEIFQVNRDGGGPMSCQYNEDATATSWKPMFMTLNQAGNSGIQNQVRTNETVVMNFPEGAKCTGGFTQTACIVRCRTGVNKRFGGCFAVKLSGSESAQSVVSNATTNSLAAIPAATATTGFSAASDKSLSDEQLNMIAQQVIIQMKKDGLILAASAAGSSCASSNVNNTSLSHISQAIQLGHNATSLASAVAKQSDNPDIINAVKFASTNSTFDASDAEDEHVNNIKPSSNHSTFTPASRKTSLDASDAEDKPPHNVTSGPDHVSIHPTSINPALDVSDAEDKQPHKLTSGLNPTSSILDASDATNMAPHNLTSASNHASSIPTPNNATLDASDVADNQGYNAISWPDPSSATPDHETSNSEGRDASEDQYVKTQQRLNVVSPASSSPAPKHTASHTHKPRHRCQASKRKQKA